MTYRSVYVGIWLLFLAQSSERKKMILFVKVKENKIQICRSGARERPAAVFSRFIS